MGNGKTLTYEVVLEPAEGGGFTVFVPSLSRRLGSVVQLFR